MPGIKEIATKLAKEGPSKFLPTPRLVQAVFNGATILKTTQSRLVWEVPYYPQLYVPRAALTKDVDVKEGEAIKSEDGTTIAHQLKLSVGSKSTDEAFAFTDALSGPAEPLRGLVKITFGALDQWYEEATPIYVHPKDPFKRVDILPSLRHIRVIIDGEVVADAHSSMHLYETGLPVRYYLPQTTVRSDILRPSDLKTKCPYKGEAEYHSVEINGKMHENVIWYYRNPTLESAKVEGLFCFYNEKVTIEIDGEKLETPVSPFSSVKPGQRPQGL